MRFAILCLSTWCLSFLYADVLVLKNGQQITFPGSYMVKGNFVRYRDAEDQLLQIPLKMVDLEASEKATKMALESQAQVEEVKPETPKKKSWSDIAEALQGKKTEEDRPKTMTLDSKSIQKYHKDNENDVVAGGLLQPEKSVGDIQEERERFQKEYDKIAKEIAEIDQKLKEVEESLVALRDVNSFGDDPTGAAYKSIESYEKRRDDLLKQRKEKMDSLKMVKEQARKSGAKSVGRTKQVKPYKSDLNKEDDLKYRSKKDEFKYNDNQGN